MSPARGFWTVILSFRHGFSVKANTGVAPGRKRMHNLALKPGSGCLASGRIAFNNGELRCETRLM